MFSRQAFCLACCYSYAARTDPATWGLTVSVPDDGESIGYYRFLAYSSLAVTTYVVALQFAHVIAGNILPSFLKKFLTFVFTALSARRIFVDEVPSGPGNIGTM